MSAPVDRDALWAKFLGRVEARMAAGARAYGDRSFSRGASDLAIEVQEELEDVMGWSFILWTRLERAREALGVDGTRGTYTEVCPACESPDSLPAVYADRTEGVRRCAECGCVFLYVIASSKVPITLQRGRR